MLTQYRTAEVIQEADVKWTTSDQVVTKSKMLFGAATQAGVRRIVHISVANASADSHLCFALGSRAVQKFLNSNRMPCATIRSTLVFGEGDLLLNNMAWALGRFPLFPVLWKGNYKV